MKFVILVLVAGIAFRMLFGTWPWQMFAESEKSQKRAQARTLLGVSRDASAEDILSAHRRAIKNAIRVAAESVRHHVNPHIEEEIQKAGASTVSA